MSTVEGGLLLAVFQTGNKWPVMRPDLQAEYELGLVYVLV